jgi:hypothetical protein
MISYYIPGFISRDVESSHMCATELLDQLHSFETLGSRIIAQGTEDDSCFYTCCANCLGS